MIIDASIVKARNLWSPEIHSVAAVLRSTIVRLEVGQVWGVGEIRNKNGVPVPLSNMRVAASKMKNRKFEVRKRHSGISITRIA